MNSIQLEQSIIKSAKGLSKEALIEVLDFIQFLKYKKTKQTMTDNISEELYSLNSESLAHLQEEFADYKTQYPLDE